MGKWVSILAVALLPVAASAQDDVGPLTVSPETETEAARMTKWLVFDLDMAYHSNYEEYEGPDGIPAKRLVKWIGAGIAIAINYDLMQCSNIWMVERSELLKTFQDLYMIRYGLDVDSAQIEISHGVIRRVLAVKAGYSGSASGIASSPGSSRGRCARSSATSSPGPIPSWPSPVRDYRRAHLRHQLQSHSDVGSDRCCGRDT